MHAYQLTKWQLRLKRAKTSIPHGTASRYINLLCRCLLCKKAWREAHLRYMHSHPEQQLRHRLYMWHKNNSNKTNGVLVLDSKQKQD